MLVYIQEIGTLIIKANDTIKIEILAPKNKTFACSSLVLSYFSASVIELTYAVMKFIKKRGTEYEVLSILKKEEVI